MENKIPLVSVVIPMFNAAKFIPQTLESLLYQTMTDFEVIVVDDCSNDNSVEVVESFSERFGGRLKLVKLPKNTGSPGIPRNVGIQIACGKYISFLDSDDLYTKTALEELSTLAEKFQADVVYMNDTFRLFEGRHLPIDDPRMTDMNVLLNPANFSFTNWRWPLMPRLQPLSEPTLKPETLEERVNFWVNWKYRLGVCANFCRRDFLIANQIFFPNMPAAEDQVFNFNCLCLAKNFLRVPNVVYIIRPRLNSESRDGTNISDAEKYFRKWIKVLKVGFNEFEKIMARIPFFEKQIALRYSVLNFFSIAIFSRHVTNKFPASHTPLLYDLVKKEFHPDDASLAAYLFNTVNVYRLHIMKLQQEIATLKNSK